MRLAIAFAASALLASSAQAVIVINGSFETGVPIPGGSVLLPSPPIDSTSLPGWNILPSGVHYVDSSVWDASAGNRSVELAGRDAGSVQQRIVNQLVTGRMYRIRFDLSANPFADNGLYGALVSASGGGAQDYFYTKTAANSPTNMLYQTYEYTWTALGPSANFQIRSKNSGSFGVVLDNVSISLVPEPAQWALMVAGFALTGYAMRRRRLPVVTA